MIQFTVSVGRSFLNLITKQSYPCKACRVQVSQPMSTAAKPIKVPASLQRQTNQRFYMNVGDQIKNYITSQPEPKRSDMQELHCMILKIMPACKLWFLDGKNSENKTVSNPNIGYGLYNIQYANGEIRAFYQIGMSANTTGISVYIMGIKDKTYLAQTYGKIIGKASVSGYCIKFKRLGDINMEILEAAIRYGVEQTEH